MCNACKGTKFVNFPVVSFSRSTPCPFCSDSLTPDMDMMSGIRYVKGLDKNGNAVNHRGEVIVRSVLCSRESKA